MAGLDFTGIQQFDPDAEPSSLVVQWQEYLSRYQRCTVGFGKGESKKTCVVAVLGGTQG